MASQWNLGAIILRPFSSTHASTHFQGSVRDSRVDCDAKRNISISLRIMFAFPNDTGCAYMRLATLVTVFRSLVFNSWALGLAALKCFELAIAFCDQAKSIALMRLISSADRVRLMSFVYGGDHIASSGMQKSNIHSIGNVLFVKGFNNRERMSDHTLSLIKLRAMILGHTEIKTNKKQ
jgi:hypothetical protein